MLPSQLAALNSKFEIGFEADGQVDEAAIQSFSASMTLF